MEFDNLFDMTKYPTFIDKQLEPDDDGLCLCLSGKKYKDCCKTKISVCKYNRKFGHKNDGLDELFLCKRSRLISVKLVERVIKKKRLGYCMAENIFGDCSCMSNSPKADVRYSHTLSRGYVLQNLCGPGKNMVTMIDDHVMVNDERLDYSDRFEPISIRDASITTSFCKKHDDYLFADIEKIDKRVYVGDYIQSVEYALKAVTFELFEYLMNIYYLASLVEKNPNVVYDSPTESKFLKDYKTFLLFFNEMKQLADKVLSDIKIYKDTGTKSDLKTEVVELKKYSHVEYSLSEVFDNSFVNVINAPNPVVIFSYYPGHENKELLKYVQDIQRKQNERTLKEFTEYILSNAKNIYFNSDVIDELSKDDLTKLYKVHREGMGVLRQGYSKFITHMVSKLYTK